MAQRRILTVCFLLAIGLPVVFTLLPGCESTPAEPDYDNPFDPDSPTGGDALNLRAVVNKATDKVTLTWDQPQGYNIATYDIWTSEERESSYSPLIEALPHSPEATQSYDYINPEPTKLLWYRVRAIDAYGNFSFIGFSRPDSSLTGPRIIAGDGSATSATRFIDLAFVVSNGNNIRLANNPEFTGDTVLTAASPGDTLVVPYDLGAATGNDTIFSLLARAFTGAVESETSAVSVRVNFRPKFTVRGDPKTVGTRNVDLTVPASGVQFMRFGLDDESLAAAVWVPGDTLFAGFELSDSANEQTILGEFAGDFGFNIMQDHTVTPDLLQGVTFKLDLPDDHITDQLQLIGLSRAAATLMRFSESPDLVTVPWQAYADTTVITLSPGVGTKTIYAQYRNDWDDSPIMTDYAIQVSQPAEVVFIAPRDGDVVNGGGTLQVRGSALAGSDADSIVAVKFDAGDGAGFQDATGTTDWTYPWTIARYDADTVINLRARAYVNLTLADTTVVDSVTATIAVTVTQLNVAISSPADGTAVPGGAITSISGSSAGILGGAPVDSVTLDVGEDHFVADGTIIWSLEWPAPRGVVSQSLPVIATAWSGAATVTDSIGLTVDPMPIVITAPVDGEEIVGGAAVAIAGQTMTTLSGAPIDSVRVDIGNAKILATGTTNWVAPWLSPVVTENTAQVIYATVFAGAESAVDSLAVTLTP